MQTEVIVGIYTVHIVQLSHVGVRDVGAKCYWSNYSFLKAPVYDSPSTCKLSILGVTIRLMQGKNREQQDREADRRETEEEFGYRSGVRNAEVEELVNDERQAEKEQR